MLEGFLWLYFIFFFWVLRKLAKGKWACGITWFMLCIVIAMEVVDEMPR